ncbi:hypothetical protein OEZ85_009602 [Tetradesmus obliquus]|uniref:Uncharacterized protein n=1 Tax=Tetradesmus obliquus TaxID=3088 RepID=A0ABY8UAJ2_TETOB|nr:hypothetical protein OEZ85_009602 [Tetradesmus obliquus]
MALDRLSAAAARAVDEYYERCRAAEQHRKEEEHAAVVLQSCWRGQLQRHELHKLSHVALTIQRCWRGYLGRQRFAAARSARNTQLREAYFNHQATVIQKCWRGQFSRSRVHDFYKRKAYLAAVAAANAAVRAGMAVELQEALQHQQQQAQQAAKQQFDAQVSRLHHLASTGCRPGIFSGQATAGAAVRVPPVVAGQPLEQHLRVAAKQQAAGTVKQQQEAMWQTIHSSMSATSSAAGFSFPAGSAAARAASAAAAAAAGPALSSSGAAFAAAGEHLPAQLRPLSGMSLPASTLYAHSAGSVNGALRGVPAAGKLAAAVVASVDDWYAARADANMPDGSFNPILTLQQSAEYEAVQQAAGLEGRISRGLMLVLHDEQYVKAVSNSIFQHHKSSNLQLS